MLLCLLTFLGCSSIFSTSPQQHNSAKRTPIFSDAFPPEKPLVCPETDTASAESSFVQAHNTQFSYKGASLKFYGYTFYPALTGGASAWHTKEFTQYIDQILDMGALAGQNIIRPTDFWDRHGHDSVQENRIVWQNVDYLVCATAKRGSFVLLDVSAFEWFLLSQGADQYDIVNWKAFLDAVGKHYAGQPSIAFYSIVGEPAPPKSEEATKRLVDFYRVVTDELHKADGGHHMIAAGGFNHMNEETAKTLWWQAIYSLPNNNVAGFKTYSKNDLHLIPIISSFARSIGKPSFNEEFGLPQGLGDDLYTGMRYNNIQSSRAQFYDDVYTLGEENEVAGFVFWNMGCQIAQKGYDVSPQTPAVWKVIQKHAPNTPAVSTHHLLC
jgi:hypothetical protein